MSMSVIIAGMTFISYFSASVSATALSLSNIEAIKNSKQANGSPFRIVEIAPTPDTGTIGYYVKGQEPLSVNAWSERAADMNLSSERTNYANNLLSRLEQNKLVSYTENGAPLRKTGNYQEVLPWTNGFNIDNYSEMALNASETFTAKGELEEQEGGAYNVDYEYVLAPHSELFNAAEWFENKHNGVSMTEFRQFDKGGITLVFDTSLRNSFILRNVNLQENDFGFMKNNGSLGSDKTSYVTLEGNKKYTISFKSTLSPATASTVTGAVRLYGFDDSYASVPVDGNAYIEKIFNTDGPQSITLNTPENMTKLAVVFGAAGRGDVRISDFSISLGSDEAKYVQDIDHYVYGEPEETFGDNIFNFTKWADNERSSVLNSNATAGADILTEDKLTGTARITTDGSGGNDIFTNYSPSPDYYFMNVKPNTEYEVSIDLKINRGSSQFHLFPYGSGVSGGKKLTFNGNANADFAYFYEGASQTKKIRFTTGADNLYIQIRIGTTTANSDVEFSNIQIREVIHPQYYYYALEIENTFRWQSGSTQTLPDEGDILYLRNDEGRFVFDKVYDSSQGINYLDRTKTYYTLKVVDGTYPTQTFDDYHCYRAEANGFREPLHKVSYQDASTHRTVTASFTKEDLDELVNNGTAVTVISSETPFFNRNRIKVTYVKPGNGNYNFELDNDGEDVDIDTSYAYYTGGFENNDWFRYKVLEANEKNSDDTPKYTFPILVSTFAPGSDGLEEALQYADLIVLTYGLNVFDTLKYESDMPAAKVPVIRDLINNFRNNRMPVIIDRRILLSGTIALSQAPNYLQMVNQLSSGISTGGVFGSVYSFMAADLSVDSMANEKFFTSTPSGYQSSSSKYYPVYDEIEKEKALREMDGTEQLEQTTVTEATIIRYIINYANPRNYNTLDKLNVLDIEPATSNPGITPAEINALLPPGSRYPESLINIVTMAVSEFVAKNEDFSEIYDIVYIGAKNENMNVIDSSSNFSFDYQYKENGTVKTATCTYSNGVPDNAYYRCLQGLDGKKLIGPRIETGDPIYNDQNMLGMYYTNVGDMMVTANTSTTERPELGGLLKEDYFNFYDDMPGWIQTITGLFSSIKSWAQTTYLPLGGHATMRSSGNDLNEAAMERLMDYANSGRPVIVSDKLSEKVSENLTATISLQTCTDHSQPIERYSTDSGFALKLHAEVDTESTILQSLRDTFDYNWYFSDNGSDWYWFGAGQDITTPDKVTVPGTNQTKDVLKVKNLARKTSNIYSFDTTDAYFKCIVSIKYNGMTKNVDSNKLHVYKTTSSTSTSRSNYDRYYMTFCKPGKGPYDGDYTFNLRNGNLQVSGEDYEYYYEGRDSFGQAHYSSPKFIDFNLYWQGRIWPASFKGKGYHYAYNQTGAIRVVPNDSYFYLKTETGTHATFAVRGFKNNSETDHDLTSDELTISATGDGDYKNQLVCYYLPKFNWTPEPSTATPIDLEAELYPEKFDNCSYMWRFLSSTFYAKPNVFSQDEQKYVTDISTSTTLSQSLAIAKPSLEITNLGSIEYPTQLPGRKLDISFCIYDKTNPDPGQAKYKAELYIDSNADGKFTADEKEDYVVPNLELSTVSPAGTEKHVHHYEKTFTDKYKGIIPWKLLVTEQNPKQGKIAGHTSYEGFSYIKPSADDAIMINALMILPGSWSHEYRKISDIIGTKIKLSSGEKNITENIWSENEYIGCVFESDVFSHLDGLTRLTNEELGVGSDGIGNDGFYHLGFNVNNGDIKIDIACWNIWEMNQYFLRDDATYEKFSPYNMLILGFGDSWGKLPSDILNVMGGVVKYNEGFELKSSLAVEDYIASGRATLFCHDTTNNSCVFVNYFINDLAGSALNAWNKIMTWINDTFNISYFDTTNSNLAQSQVKQGYWNNMILREVLGLDRYGITYAIKHRANAIANGKDPDNESSRFVDYDPYGKALGRAHMYNYIYDYQYAKDSHGENLLSIKNMLNYTDEGTGLTHNHSIAWVPGTASTYPRNSTTNTAESTVSDNYYHLEKQTINAELGLQDYRPVKNNKTKVYMGQNKLDQYGVLVGASYDRYTQGFTDYTITRYSDPSKSGSQFYPTKFLKAAYDANGWGNSFKTNKITQINSGKITRYPYDIDVPNLHTEGMNETWDIEQTHEQVYQCNMNGDDITVWYALSGGRYYNYDSSTKKSTGIRNNAANAYYIFSRKNLTYTGAGHTNKFSEVEAKLFINTLVAAYRQSGVAPTLSYKDISDKKTVNYVYVVDNVNDEGQAVVESIFKEQEQNYGSIFFKVDDKNTGTGKEISVELYCYDSANNKIALNSEVSKLYETNPYTSQTQQSTATLAKLHEQTLYSFEIPNSVKQMFVNDPTLTSIKIYAKPSTKVINQDAFGNATGNSQTYAGEAVTIEVVRVQLSDLA